jgi:hypothetical protein
MSAHDLWAITSYFNPQQYRRRLANYRHFRQHLPIPLLTVELSFGGAFELQEGDANILLQLCGGDVLWQKERLLNVGLAALPRDCRFLAAMDCDVIVGGENWPDKVTQALDEFAVVQPFRRLHHLVANASVEDMTSPGATEFWRPSLAHALKTGWSSERLLERVHDRVQGTPTTGFLWATRKSLLMEHGFFDACIVGGGDSALGCAAYGRCEELCRHHNMNPAQRRHYLRWAVPFTRAVRGAVGDVDCPVYHLWHGAIRDRQTRERHEGLRPFDFDPARDLALADSGAWRWNSYKPDLHRYVADYFVARREDGA